MALKIVIAGPKQTGKTTIANFLAEQTPSLVVSPRYDPTVGVRILEFEKAFGAKTVQVEIWDSSGDHKFESCWPAIMQDADGVILVYNPEAAGQTQEIGDWYEYFVKQKGLSESQCLVFAHHHSSEAASRFRPPPLFARTKVVKTTSETGSNMKRNFEDFVREIDEVKRRGTSGEGRMP